jgi:hypothetical protein
MLNFFVEVVHQLHAAAEIHPGGLHATVETERDRGAEGESRILAEIIVRRGVAHLDRAGLHGIGRLQTRHDLAGGENLDLELVVGGFGDGLGESVRCSVDGVERFRIARSQPPFELRHGLRNRRIGERRRGSGEAGCLQELSAFHLQPSLVAKHASRLQSKLDV